MVVGQSSDWYKSKLDTWWTMTMEHTWRKKQNPKVRVAERSVEGRHSSVHRILKRAPRASICYISLEMRFPYIQRIAATQPECMQNLGDALVKMETTAGVRRAVMSFVSLLMSVSSFQFVFVFCIVIVCLSQHDVSIKVVAVSTATANSRVIICQFVSTLLLLSRSLLGLDRSVEESLVHMTVAELVKLVYRDHIPLKHANRKRLAAELDDKTDKLPAPAQRMAINAGDEQDHDTKLLSSMLIRYLMQVSCLNISSKPPSGCSMQCHDNMTLQHRYQNATQNVYCLRCMLHTACV